LGEELHPTEKYFSCWFPKVTKIDNVILLCSKTFMGNPNYFCGGGGGEGGEVVVAVLQSRGRGGCGSAPVPLVP